MAASAVATAFESGVTIAVMASSDSPTIASSSASSDVSDRSNGPDGNRAW